MDEVKWRRLEAIYHAALSREPDDRSAYVAEACEGDEELEREVTSLLRQDVSKSAFLDHPAEEALGTSPSPARHREFDSPLGKTLLHYRVVEKLGEGGMGVVYKAEDTKLRRTVALKFPPIGTVSGEPDQERFLREAQAAAALNHPNICTVHDIDEADGQPFIAMELIEGRSVREKLAKRPLRLEEALDIAVQAARGLAAAHEAGIVHRDIKSANLMVTRQGQVKVMDFGLAQVRDRSHLTKTGTTLGTAAYMSPEQALAKETDHRTDIWSLGVVLYEMLTGRLPFGGEVEAAIAYAVVNVEPEPPTALRSGLPVELDRIIDKALAKDPRERYQHVEEMIVDLRALDAGPRKSFRKWAVTRRTRRRIQRAAVAALFVLLAVGGALNLDRLTSLLPAPSGPQIDSIAILPLQNLSGDPEQQYLSDGMTEALYTDLAKISGLKVVSPRSARRYQGNDVSVRQIADELGVDALVQGSAVRTGDRVRVTAQLIDARSDESLWAESYERTFRDVLALQNEAARAIARRIQVELTPDEGAATEQWTPGRSGGVRGLSEGRLRG